jgi:hypothetical protein
MLAQRQWPELRSYLFAGLRETEVWEVEIPRGDRPGGNWFENDHAVLK